MSLLVNNRLLLFYHRIKAKYTNKSGKIGALLVVFLTNLSADDIIYLILFLERVVFIMEGFSFTAVFIIMGLVLVSSILGKISSITRSLAPLLRMLQLAEGAELKIPETPKSISSVTRLELPRLEKDFPEFHWPEWRQRSQNILQMYLEAVEHQQPSYLKEVGQGLYDEVRLAIEENRERDIKEKFDNLKFHATEIARYEREALKCRVLVQMSVEYLHSLKASEKMEADRVKEQHAYELEIVYIQDITAVGDGTTGYGVSCPNCGAPITNLGDKFCTYCGTAVEPINIRVWTPNHLKQIA